MNERLTAQEYYDLLVKSARDGTFPSFKDEEKRCLYRFVDGEGKVHKCAAGVLLTDEEYRSGHIREGVSCHCGDNKDVFALKLPESISLDELRSVQWSHDKIAMQDGGWDAEDFIRLLNTMVCFKEVNQVAA